MNFHDLRRQAASDPLNQGLLVNYFLYIKRLDKEYGSAKVLEAAAEIFQINTTIEQLLLLTKCIQKVIPDIEDFLCDPVLNVDLTNQGYDFKTSLESALYHLLWHLPVEDIHIQDGVAVAAAHFLNVIRGPTAVATFMDLDFYHIVSISRSAYRFFELENAEQSSIFIHKLSIFDFQNGEQDNSILPPGYRPVELDINQEGGDDFLERNHYYLNMYRIEAAPPRLHRRSMYTIAIIYLGNLNQDEFSEILSAIYSEEAMLRDDTIYPVTGDHSLILNVLEFYLHNDNFYIFDDLPGINH